MEGDEESARGGVTARVYCQLLEDQIPKIYRRGQIFQHDNASIHTANIIKDWLRNHKINVMDWPANSLDLNLIKTLWVILKDRLNKHHPELFDIGSG